MSLAPVANKLMTGSTALVNARKGLNGGEKRENDRLRGNVECNDVAWVGESACIELIWIVLVV